MSKAIRVLSVMSLPGIKALWLSDMILGNKGLILFVMVLVMSLRMALQREMGLKSLGEVGFCFFEIRHILVCL